MKTLLLMGALAVTLAPFFVQAQERPLTTACRTDLARRVGVWQNNADIACPCMFEGDSGWKPTGKTPKVVHAKESFVFELMSQGVGGYSHNTARPDGLTLGETVAMQNFVRVYPALLAKNKAVVQCFNDKCREVGCDVQMNDVSGTAPR